MRANHGHGGRGRGKRRGGLSSALGDAFRSSGHARSAVKRTAKAGDKRRRGDTSEREPRSDAESGYSSSVSSIEDDTGPDRRAREPVRPASDPDEEAAAKLEKKLGLRRSSKLIDAAQVREKHAAKLQKEFAGDFGDGFGEFLVDLDDIGGRVDAAGGPPESLLDSDGGTSDRGSEAAGDFAAPSAASQASPYQPPHRKLQRADTPGSAPGVSLIARPERDLYGRSAPSVVVPGSRGGAGGAAMEWADVDAARPSESRSRIRKRMQGLVNRLSESNIEPVARDIEAIFASEAQVGPCSQPAVHLSPRRRPDVHRFNVAGGVQLRINWAHLRCVRI
jgi:hypothetical protein